MLSRGAFAEPIGKRMTARVIDGKAIVAELIEGSSVRVHP
jgi:hypothetical protein